MERNLSEILEALLLSASRPISIDDIVKVFEDPKPSKDEIRNALNQIDQDCLTRGIELKKIASGYRLQVKQSLSQYIAKLWEEKPQKFSKATLETLSLIAYKQPITRGEIEEIRGVAVGTQLIRGLMERGWVKIVGQRDVPGRPSLYSTTKEFLDYFGLQHLRELPELPSLPDLTSIEHELPIDDPDDSIDSSQSLN
jgi:segregation and condensation protein B|tara:strand:+ start:1142 stop:1732 length:591 start_codon:yes stop_codon:yes gene_type:complete